MTKAIHQYDEISMQYILGELGGVVQNEDQARLSSELDALISENIPADVADKLIDLLADYSAACQRDGFTGGMSVGIRIGLVAAARRASHDPV